MEVFHEPLDYDVQDADQVTALVTTLVQTSDGGGRNQTDGSEQGNQLPLRVTVTLDVFLSCRQTAVAGELLIVRPPLPLLAVLVRWMASPILPSASVTMAQVRPAISLARIPALKLSRTRTRFRSG